MRDEQRVLDKKGVKNLLRELNNKHPEQYKDVISKLTQLGALAAYTSGSSFSLKDLESSQTKLRVVNDINKQLRRVLSNTSISDEERNNRIVRTLAKHMDELREGTHNEGLTEGNNFSRSIASGARGNLANLSSLRGADLLVLDHKDRPIPIPIVHNFSEGLTPAEYFATAYGTRRGVIATKMATADAGYMGKMLANAAAPLLVTDEEPLPNTGLPVDVDDEDNEGAVLARDYGKFKAGTVLTPSILRALKSKGMEQIVIHSPISAGGRGVPRLAAGIRERGGFSSIGDNIGLGASQSLSERLSQGMLSSKHSAGVVGAAIEPEVSGFQAISQLVQIPKSFRNAATLANLDGTINRIDEAPQGGAYIWIGDQRHYVHAGLDINVKPGDRVEAGDALSSGIPNPAEVVKHKHIGEGRRYFVDRLRKTLQDQGISVNRRNLELISRSLINHVQVIEEDGTNDGLPDDILTYDKLAHGYRPRFGNVTLPVGSSRDKFLEVPALHYSIGTRITPSVIDTLKKHDIKQITVHNDPPSFEPHMVRAMESTVNDPDWFRRLGGFNIGKAFMSAAQRGSSSEIGGQNWVHALARGQTFGRNLGTKAEY